MNRSKTGKLSTTDNRTPWAQPSTAGTRQATRATVPNDRQPNSMGTAVYGRNPTGHKSHRVCGGSIITQESTVGGALGSPRMGCNRSNRSFFQCVHIVGWRRTCLRAGWSRAFGSSYRGTVMGTSGGPSFGGGPTFSGVGAGCRGVSAQKNILPKPSILETAVFTCASLCHLAHLRTGRGAAAGGSPPALPRPVRRGARKVHSTHARVHFNSLAGDAWAGWGAKRGCGRRETAGQRSGGPSCRRPAPAPTEFPCPLPLFMSFPYTVDTLASTVHGRFGPTLRNPWATKIIFLADRGHSAGPSFLKSQPNRAARTALDSSS
jgi:hypothetical protein